MRDEINYTRTGGIVSFEKYLSSKKSGQRDKFLSKSRMNKPQYINYTFGNDNLHIVFDELSKELVEITVIVKEEDI